MNAMSATNSLPKETVSSDVASFAGRTYLSVLDLSPDTLEACLMLAGRLKRERRLGAAAPTARALAGHTLALLFDKPSLRTRTGFEIAMRELGGHVSCPPSADALGSREPLADVARTLERWVSIAAIRTFEHTRLREFVEATTRLRVVNALTNEEHPCQALADCLTVHERCGALRGRTLAYVGDGNNVATSLTHAAMMLGLNLRLASPKNFAVQDETLDAARRVARHGAQVVQGARPGRGGSGRRRRVRRCLDLDGTGGGPDASPGSVPGVSDHPRAHGRGQRRRRLHALPAGTPGRRGRRGRLGGPALRRVRPGGKPAPYPEGIAADDARRRTTRSRQRLERRWLYSRQESYRGAGM